MSFSLLQRAWLRLPSAVILAEKRTIEVGCCYSFQLIVPKKLHIQMHNNELQTLSHMTYKLSSEYSGLIFFRMDWLDLFAVQGIPKSLHQHHNIYVYMSLNYFDRVLKL